MTKKHLKFKTIGVLIVLYIVQILTFLTICLSYIIK